MNTCEQCGADAVDARGICRNCGWQERSGRFSDTNDTPSLGATRAAEAPPGRYSASSPSSPAPRNTRMNPYSPETRSTALAGGATSGGRFCGTCGARLESGMAFCGQCGTPVSTGAATGMGYGASGLRQSGQEQYRVGGWSDGDGNELTEAMPGPGAPGYNGFGRSGPGLPYGGTPYHPAGYGPSRQAPAARSSHTTRLLVGVLCLIGSIISATSAIILAITMGH